MHTAPNATQFILLTMNLMVHKMKEKEHISMMLAISKLDKTPMLIVFSLRQLYINGTYNFHASTAAYSEYWTNSFGKNHSIKIPRRQIWQAFIQESIRSIASALNIIFETNDNLPIAELTNKAYSLLGEDGGIRLANGHTCPECTQEYKATANYGFQNNDPAVLLGVDDNRPVSALR